MATITGDDIEIAANGGGALQQYLNTTEADVKTLCLLSTINKWSKNKPIEYNKYESLTATERKNGQKYAQGYRWGVKIVGSARLDTIHDFTFDYDKPTTYFRLTDFIGYDKNATADIYGTELTPKVYRDLNGYQYRVTISIDSSNTTGISVKDALKDALSMSGATDEMAFLNIYPILIIDKKACVMRNTTKGTVTSIYANKTWYEAFDANVQSVLTTYNKGTAIRMTIGLVAYKSQGSASGIDISGNWFDIDGLSFTDSVFPLPGLLCLNKTVDQYYSDYTCVLTGLTANREHLSFGFTMTPTPDVNIEMIFGATTGGVRSTVNYTYTPGQIQLSPQIKWSDLGYFTNPTLGTKITIDNATVQYRKVGDTQYTNGTGLSDYEVTISSVG